MIEQHAAFRIEPAGDQRGDHLAGIGREFGRIVGNADRVQIGEKIETDPALRRRFLLKGNIVVELTDKEFQILALLMKRSSEVITRDDFLKTIWSA